MTGLLSCRTDTDGYSVRGSVSDVGEWRPYTHQLLQWLKDIGFCENSKTVVWGSCPCLETLAVDLMALSLQMFVRLKNKMKKKRIIKFPFKRKVLPSHPPCNPLSHWIKLSLNFPFPMRWDWLKWFQFWKSWKSCHYWTYCHFCFMMQASISLWLLNLFQIGVHIMCTSGYTFVCKFWEAYLVFFMTIFAVSLESSAFSFSRLSALSFIHVWWCQVSWVWKIFQILTRSFAHSFIHLLRR